MTDSDLYRRADALRQQGCVTVPAPSDLTYYDYQLEAISWLVSHPNAMLCDAMGLGKTCMLIGLSNLLKLRSILVVVPASIRHQMASEFARWSTLPGTVGVVTSGRHWPDADTVICTYSLLGSHRRSIRQRRWDLLWLDESHYLKSPGAQRTREVYGAGRRDSARYIPRIEADRVVCTTGTPILNRPIELWTTLHRLDPSTYDNYISFARRFCGAKMTRWGWDVTGASHLDELSDQLKGLMLRRRKEEVLTSLPPKRHVTFCLEDTPGVRDLIKREAKLENLVEGGGSAVEFAKLSTVRHELGLSKIPGIIAHLRSYYEAEVPVIFFAQHLDVLSAVHAEFNGGSVLYTGRQSIPQKETSRDSFRRGKAWLWCGQIMASGVGLNLQRCGDRPVAHVLFGELDWTPSLMDQCADRAHRIGQTDTVLVEYIVYDRSLDARIAETMIRKQRILAAVLDN